MTCEYVERRWRDVRVGDWVRVSANEAIPADLLLLRCSSTQGVCYVETSNLDGESNLKPKHVLIILPQHRRSEKSFLDGQVLPCELSDEEVGPSSFNGSVECEGPNAAIYRFRGVVVWADGRRQTATREQLLLRGSQLRNTKHAEGLVLYAGHDTKATIVFVEVN